MAGLHLLLDDGELLPEAQISPTAKHPNTYVLSKQIAESIK
jgi:hypothetical protein